MWFELSVACKYLIPRRRQLSVSIISLISIAVIALVVWLTLLFLSVTVGMEKNWLEKLVAVNGPIQITPTESYYNSYYYLVDTIASDSDYQNKGLGEKLVSEDADPYDPSVDVEIPSHWPLPDIDDEGAVRDLVKDLVQSVEKLPGFPGLRITDYELAYSQMRLRMLRHHGNDASLNARPTQTFLTPQGSFLAVGSFDGANPFLQKTLLPPSEKDLSNLLYLLSISAHDIHEDKPTTHEGLHEDLLRDRLQRFFRFVTITHLKVSEYGWEIPYELLPPQGALDACAVLSSIGRIEYLLIPQEEKRLSSLARELERRGRSVAIGTLHFDKGQFLFSTARDSDQSLPIRPLLLLEEGALLPATLDESSLNTAKRLSALRFAIDTSIQGMPLRGTISYGHMHIGRAEAQQHFQEQPFPAPLWPYTVSNSSGAPRALLPNDPQVGIGVLVSQKFEENGVLVGDRGYVTYFTSGAGAVQEQRMPVYIAGFYDSGVMPIGSKMVLADREVTSLIRASLGQQEQQNSNGFQVWLDDLSQVDALKAALEQTLREHDLSRYWHLETFKEYDFARGLFQQFQSDKNLFFLIATLIILVACSNIISMLIILVKDKKYEIGILLSMGASTKSIALIFGFCGVVMGLIGSLLGISASLITLENLQVLVDLISTIQGYDAFSEAYYGQSLPNQLSYGALYFVTATTIVLSLLAGLIPAYKATRMHPATILREE